MCDLSSYCVFDSSSVDRAVSTCSLSDPGSGGQRLSISVQRNVGEVLKAYDLERYFGNRDIARSDRLLIGRVEDGPLVVVFVEFKSGSGWADAQRKFRAMLPAFGKGGGDESEGRLHHRECGQLLTDGEGHSVIALVVGRVGREYRIANRRGNRRPAERRLSYGGKTVLIVPPLSRGRFDSLAGFWKQLGIMPR